MEARPKRRIDEIGEQSRIRILDAAETLFAERGYERTSFADIAQQSGISRGSIPWHFDNKDGLLMAVVERMIGRSFATETDPKHHLSIQELTQWFRTFVQRRDEGQSNALVFSLLTQAISTDGLIHTQYKAFFQRRRQDLVTWVRTDRILGRVLAKRDVELLGTVMHAALLGIQLQYVLDPESVDLDASLHMFAKMVETMQAAHQELPGAKQS